MSRKEGFARFKSTVACVEIMLLVFATISFSFVLNSAAVSAADLGGGAYGPPAPGSPPNPPTTSFWNSNADLAQPGSTGGTAAGSGGPLELVNNIWEGKIFGDPGQVTPFGAIVSSLAWAAVAYGAAKMLTGLFGVDDKTGNAISAAAAFGAGAGRLTYFVVERSTFFGSSGTTAGQSLLGSGAQTGFVVGIAVAVVVFALTYKKESKKIVELTCLPWEAPLGGSDCEKCNDDPFKPCSEYRCKSLGQACGIVNAGTTEERCVWISRGDVNSPVISTWNSVLTPGHAYNPNNAIRPPNRGFTIVNRANADGCIKAFTPLQFGITLNEPAQCKIDAESGNKTFDEMQYYFGESNFYQYNHTQQLRLPSPDSINAEGLEIPTEGLYNFYVRCRDANGNVNDDVFAINFCVDKSPDTTPPLVESTSISDGSPIQFGVQSVPFALNLNEPSECRWSPQDKDYSLMENNMSCSTHVYEENAQQLYPCTTTLNGLQDQAQNAFFFRCKDQPLKEENVRNVNRESFRFTLRGSQTLSILSAGPTGKITGNTDSISVNLTATTDDGADEGKSVCYFSPTGQEGTYVTMFETSNFQHKQILNLGTGSYNYYLRCVDAGGNAASTNVSFSVETDRAPPRVTRIYKESDALKLVTNENAECRYSINSCNFVFGEGLTFNYFNAQDRKNHILQWNTNQVHYIKCKDDFGNEPQPNACSITVSPLIA